MDTVIKWHSWFCPYCCTQYTNSTVYREGVQHGSGYSLAFFTLKVLWAQLEIQWSSKVVNWSIRQDPDHWQSLRSKTEIYTPWKSHQSFSSPVKHSRNTCRTLIQTGALLTLLKVKVLQNNTRQGLSKISSPSTSQEPQKKDLKLARKWWCIGKVR